MSEWKTESLSRTFLHDVRGAIPGAELQLDLIARIARKWCAAPSRILDLGCGDGLLGEMLLDLYPSAHLVLVDFSPPMLEAAKTRFGTTNQTSFVEADFSTSRWLEALPVRSSFDLVVSGFAVHHQPDLRKQEIYSEIACLLAPSGVFLNLEHVASRTPAGTELFDDLFIDSLWRFHRNANSAPCRSEVAGRYYNRPDKAENLLAPVEEQCAWLRSIGFEDVDCFLKIFELALFGGRKPS